MKRPIVFHTILFGIFPVIFLYSNNLHILVLDDIVLPLLLVIGATILLWFTLKKVLKSKEKSGLLISLYLLLFFTFGHIWILINGFEIGGFEIGRLRFLFILYIILFLIGSYYLYKTKRKLDNVTTITNYMAIALLIIAFVNIGTYHLENYQYSDVEITSGKIPFDVSQVTTFPNVYYIILDAYANSHTLKEDFDYDNQEFITFLTDSGFNVADKSYSNYPVSLLSIPSTMNMKYLNYLSERYDDSKDRHELYRLLDRNLVMQYFKTMGYQIINFDGGNLMGDIKIADKNLCEIQFWHNQVWLLLQHTTILNAFPILQSAGSIREYKICVFSELPALEINNEKPIFVFAHIAMPHSPYLFGENGEPKNPKTLFFELQTEDPDKKGYLEQLKFTNKKIQEVIDKILKESKTSPIIIIQSDHGPRMGVDWKTAYNDEKLVKRIFSNFDAYYFPGEKKPSLIEPRTPVNTFRIVFNHYFNGTFDMLENAVYYTNAADKLFQFRDVTDILIEK